MRFALMGLAGYVAKKHVFSIKKTNNFLVAAMDPNDNVGFIDSYFDNVTFFTKFERFDRFIEKLNNANDGIDYISVCTPNYLHDSHIRSALKWNSNAICEKPLVLSPWNLDSISRLEKTFNKSVYPILQLRLHPSIIKLKEKITNCSRAKIYDVELTYITPRGPWYYSSWKGQSSMSGGIATNIGIHFFDILIWIFGSVKKSILHIKSHDRCSGFLQLEKANIRWFLSIDKFTLPKETENSKAYRCIKIDNEVFEFSDGFENLHLDSYKNILSNNGFTLDDARPSIEITHKIQSSNAIGLKGEYHPFSKLIFNNHPFKHI
ncbi:MAG: gfo/Idh/MocA family oxidoreductase [Flavobacteriales bacterium TMED288]|nr:oxidoreductase [Flavobacteriales bacterium]RPG53049.1 MAG: gfo/Idh/MocA family oxidoreductase [Flavobacteriales bacterium TMED288]